MQHAHNVWTAPIEALVIIGLLLWKTGGVYGLPALGVVVIVLPLQYYFGICIAGERPGSCRQRGGRARVCIVGAQGAEWVQSEHRGV